MDATREFEIAFVGHDASRTGAPMFLLHLIRWLGRNTSCRMSVVLLGSGPLVQDYAQACRTVVLDAWVDKLFRRLLDLLASIDDRFSRPFTSCILMFRQRRIRRAIHRAHPKGLDILYVNTTVASEFLIRVSKTVNGQPRVVFHTHEMANRMIEQIMRFSGRHGRNVREALREIGGVADLVLCPSETTRLSIAAEGFWSDVDVAVQVVPECIDMEELAAEGAIPSDELDTVRAGMGYSGDMDVVLACGTLDLRKGADLFIQVAIAVRRQHSARVCFVWLGSASGPDGTFFDTDRRLAGLGDVVRRIDTVSDPGRYLAQADVFLLPSREDPFPLAALEAAALGKPVVCFESVGTAEFVRGGGGMAVPHLDIERMAGSVVLLLQDKRLRKRVGAEAAARAKAYDVGTVGPRVHELLGGLL